jgi:hypothetical protein
VTGGARRISFLTQQTGEEKSQADGKIHHDRKKALIASKKTVPKMPKKDTIEFILLIIKKLSHSDLFQTRAISYISLKGKFFSLRDLTRIPRGIVFISRGIDLLPTRQI